MGSFADIAAVQRWIAERPKLANLPKWALYLETPDATMQVHS
jgi:hypothetical protein